jgi:hypothetical protein
MMGHEWVEGSKRSQISALALGERRFSFYPKMQCSDGSIVVIFADIGRSCNVPMEVLSSSLPTFAVVA